MRNHDITEDSHDFKSNKIFRYNIITRRDIEQDIGLDVSNSYHGFEWATIQVTLL